MTVQILSEKEKFGNSLRSVVWSCHYRMKGYLTIDTEDEYIAWLDEQAEILEEESGDDDDW